MFCIKKQERVWFSYCYSLRRLQRIAQQFTQPIPQLCTRHMRQPFRFLMPKSAVLFSMEPVALIRDRSPRHRSCGRRPTHPLSSQITIVHSTACRTTSPISPSSTTASEMAGVGAHPPLTMRSVKEGRPPFLRVHVTIAHSGLVAVVVASRASHPSTASL